VPSPMPAGNRALIARLQLVSPGCIAGGLAQPSRMTRRSIRYRVKGRVQLSGVAGKDANLGWLVRGEVRRSYWHTQANAQIIRVRQRECRDRRNSSGSPFPGMGRLGPTCTEEERSVSADLKLIAGWRWGWRRTARREQRPHQNGQQPTADRFRMTPSFVRRKKIVVTLTQVQVSISRRQKEVRSCPT
jgi:hypothetical protein